MKVTKPAAKNKKNNIIATRASFPFGINRASARMTPVKIIKKNISNFCPSAIRSNLFFKGCHCQIKYMTGKTEKENTAE